jgi:hypothetical protein
MEQATIKNPGSNLILAKITKVIIFIMTFVVNILRKVLSISTRGSVSDWG